MIITSVYVVKNPYLKNEFELLISLISFVSLRIIDLFEEYK